MSRMRSLGYRMKEQLRYVPYLFMKKKTLVDKLDSRDWYVRSRAARRLKKMCAYKRKMSEEERTRVKVKSLLILGGGTNLLDILVDCGSDAFPHLINAFKDHHSVVGDRAENVMAWTDRDAMTDLLVAMKDENEKVRERAASVIFGHSIHKDHLITDDVMAVVRNARRDENKTVSWIAGQTMNMINTRLGLYRVLMQN